MLDRFLILSEPSDPVSDRIAQKAAALRGKRRQAELQIDSNGGIPTWR